MLGDEGLGDGGLDQKTTVVEVKGWFSTLREPYAWHGRSLEDLRRRQKVRDDDRQNRGVNLRLNVIVDRLG